MTIPESMRAELAAWNDGRGITLEDWTGCMGNFSLAVGYAAVFWPEFVEFEDHVLRKGFSPETLRDCGSRPGADRSGTEWLMNHLHIADIQFLGCPDLSKDKILILGNVLKEIYQVKLKHDFPNRDCEVEFLSPDDPDDLIGYQISFWTRRDAGL